MVKYIVSLLFGCVAGAIIISYVKYKTTLELVKQYEKEKEVLQKKNKKLEKELEETRKQKSDELLLKEIENLRKELIATQTEKANLDISFKKLQEKYEKVSNFIRMDEEKILELYEESKKYRLDRIGEFISKEEKEYISLELLLLNHMYKLLSNLSFHALDELGTIRKIKNYEIISSFSEFITIVEKLYQIILKLQIFYQQKSIFLKTFDIVHYFELHPYRWRILNSLYFTNIPLSVKITLIKIAKKAFIPLKNIEFTRYTNQKYRVFYLYKKIFEFLEKESDEQMHKIFFVYFFLCEFKGIFWGRHTLSALGVDKNNEVRQVAIYYSIMYKLDDEQIKKIIPYVRIFVDEVSEKVNKIKAPSFASKILKYWWESTLWLYHTLFYQTILEERIKMFLNNEQLYEVNNRIRETLPLEISPK